MKGKPRAIEIKRAYDAPADRDGYRVLVDRYWPRGRNKDDLKLDAWVKEIAPAADLIAWFGHEESKWGEFRQRYEAELAEPDRRARLRSLLEAAGSRRLTLVYGASDPVRNQAVVLRDELLTLDAGAAPHHLAKG